MNKKDMCCVFGKRDPQIALNELHFDIVKAYGDKCGDVVLHTWDEGQRDLVRCRDCGKLLLRQFSEFHGEEDSCYVDFFPVENKEDAESLNKQYNGFQIEVYLQRPFLSETNDKAAWLNKELLGWK